MTLQSSDIVLRIKELLNDSQLTREQFSKKIGIDQSNFSNKFYYLMNIPTIAVIHGRKNKNHDNGVYAVEIRLTANRKVRYASTGVKVKPSEWRNGYVVNRIDSDIRKNMHSHLSRSTFATFMLSNGCSIQNVSKMLGHTNLKQTMKYADILEKDVRSDYDMIAKKLKKE